MKRVARTGGGGGWKIPTEEEVEVSEILLILPKLCRSFTWGRKMKRSVLDSKSESPENNVAATDAHKSPSTPLCFLPSGSGSGSDGGDRSKPPSAAKNVLKRKAKVDDLMEKYNRMQQEREILMKKLKTMKTLHQELTYENLELKAKRQKINYARNIHIWNSPRKPIDKQITMFAPATPQQPQPHCLQKLVGVSNSNGDGRFGLSNQIYPRVNIQGETYDLMPYSQPLDQSKYLVMDSDLRVRIAAAARKRRMLLLRMKENKKKHL